MFVYNQCVDVRHIEERSVCFSLYINENHLYVYVIYNYIYVHVCIIFRLCDVCR